MDTTDNSNATDDQELAKVLDDMNQQAGIPAVPTDEPSDDAHADPAQNTAPAPTDEPSDGMSFEEAPVPTIGTVDEAAASTDVTPATPDYSAPTTITSATPSANPELDAIKKTALEELRPLVDKLDLPPEEKFDTLLLLLRSTDDKTLVTAAHEAARNIPDETKRAQALLDVIKEIDYFSGHGQAPA